MDEQSCNRRNTNAPKEKKTKNASYFLLAVLVKPSSVCFQIFSPLSNRPYLKSIFINFKNTTAHQ